MAHFHGNVSGKHVHGDGSWSSAPAIVALVPTASGATVTYSGTVTHYRVNGGTAVAVPSNPFTFTGLAENTQPHTVELSGDGGSTWPVSSAPFGTLNPGTGSGEPLVPVLLQAAEATDAAFNLLLMQLLTPALETDQAVPLELVNPGVITAAEEQDLAVALQLIAPITLGVAVESNAAISLASTGGLPGGLVRALSRTFVVYPDVMIAGGLPSSTLLRPRFLKDPQARLDYSWDLRPYLAEAADALAGFAVLSSGTVTLEGPYLVDSVVTVVAAGVADGELAELTLRFDTAGGRQDDRTIELQGLQR
jgi:hypothetical protein